MPVLTNATDTDFPTLGVDDNGIYISVAINTNAIYYYSNAIIAIKKPQIYEGTLITHSFPIARFSESMPVAGVVPAINFDSLPTNGYTWFVMSGPPSLGSNCLGGEIWYRKLHWVGTNAFLDTNWWILSEPSPTYRDYYDLVITNVWAPEATSESGSPIRLWPIGSRITTAVVRNGYLWTCQAIGLSGTNGVYIGDDSAAAVDRSGVQWLKIKADFSSGALSYIAHGRIWDPAASDPYWYYFPSMMVNCAGDMVAAFSGSKASTYIGALYTCWSAGARRQSQVRQIRQGSIPYSDWRWGDYSATTLDPTDGITFWTVQEYADSAADPAAPWQTVITRIRLQP